MKSFPPKYGVWVYGISSINSSIQQCRSSIFLYFVFYGWQNNTVQKWPRRIPTNPAVIALLMPLFNKRKTTNERVAFCLAHLILSRVRWSLHGFSAVWRGGGWRGRGEGRRWGERRDEGGGRWKGKGREKWLWTNWTYMHGLQQKSYLPDKCITYFGGRGWFLNSFRFVRLASGR